MSVESILSEKNIPVPFIRATSADALLWLLGEDGQYSPPGPKIYFWPVCDGFKKLGEEPIRAIPSVFEFKKTRKYSIKWAHMIYKKNPDNEFVIVYFNKNILGMGYDVDKYVSNSDQLFAAEHVVDLTLDYGASIAAVEPLLPLGHDQLNGRLPSKIMLADPIADNRQFFDELDENNELGDLDISLTMWFQIRSKVPMHLRSGKILYE